MSSPLLCRNNMVPSDQCRFIAFPAVVLPMPTTPTEEDFHKSFRLALPPFLAEGRLVFHPHSPVSGVQVYPAFTS